MHTRTLAANGGHAWLDRLEDDILLRREIDKQEERVRCFDAARGAAAQGRDALLADEAEYNFHQARRYLAELQASLKEVTAVSMDATEDIPLPRQKRKAIARKSGLAVVIGHSPTGDMGASGLSPPFPAEPKSGRVEYYWNREVAEWIKAALLAQGVRCEIFHRMKNAAPGILEVYRKVKAWGPAAAVELHFNSSDGGTARGTETLYELADSKTWARTLQSAMVGLYGHKGKLTERGSKLDRGIKRASDNGRGVLSLTQVEPSALIEPFFGNNRIDAELGVSKKRELAAAIASAFLQYTGTQSSAPAPPETQPSEQPVVQPIAITTLCPTLWERVRAAYELVPIEFPHLKGITYAQWGYESGHGGSTLARDHLNFGGLKYRDFLAGIASPIPYTDSTGRRDNYCKFATLENFFKGYWSRFDKIASYDGWREHTGTPEAYIRFIAHVYAPPNENSRYLERVLSIYERYKAAGKLPFDKSAATPQAAPGEPNFDGFVLRVDRVRTESRQGKVRTVGFYRAFFNRELITGLEGVCLEQKGPGDNTSTGGVYDRRIAAGAYPLLTHGGEKYATYGYTSGRSRPKPGIRIGNTGARVAILFHPGGGFLASEGCLNLCGPMPGAAGDMNFMESRARVIAMIEAMKQRLGEQFPKKNNAIIPGAWMIIAGEPGAAREAEGRFRDLLDNTPEARSRKGRQPKDSEPVLSEAETYQLLAAAMNGQVLRDHVSLALFDTLASGQSNLAETRNDHGENLWREWASGWQASFAIAGIDERARAQSELAKIAARLKEGGVDVNDSKGRRTPLTTAASGNQWESVASLHNQGANLDLHDRNGDTPLTIAAYQGAVETVEYLTSAGAGESARTHILDEPPAENTSGAASSEKTALECARAAREMADTASRAAIYDRIIAILNQR